MRGLLEPALLTLLALGAAASCSDTQNAGVSDPVGGEAGDTQAGHGGAAPADGGRSSANGGSSQGGSSGKTGSGKGGKGTGGSGGDAASSGGTAAAGDAGGADSMGGETASTGGDTASSGGMAAAGDSGGVSSMGGVAGVGGSPDEGPPPYPGHAATICDPDASYGSPFPASLAATRLAESYFFTEGPVWIASGGYLLFTDMYNVTVAPYVPGGHIRRFTPPSTFDTFIEDSDSNGLALSTDGLTLFAARRIKANTDDGEIASYLVASKAKSTVLDSPVDPNDLAVRSDDNLYFSDGDVYRIDPDGQPSTAVQVDAESANGVMLSPDERTLYSAWSDGIVYASALDAAGNPSAKAPLATMQYDGHPDGMTVDCAGNLYIADYTHGIVQVFDSAGTFLDRITLPAAPGSSPPAEHATNVAFGGSDHRTLFITGHRGSWNDPAIGELHSITLNVPGLPY